MKGFLKFTLILLGLFIFTISLSACSSAQTTKKPTSKNVTTIQSVELSDFEDSMLSAVTDQLFTYDIALNTKTDRTLKLYVDTYEKGKLISTSKLATHKMDSETNAKKYQLAIMRSNEDTLKEPTKWSTVISTEGATVTCGFEQERPTPNYNDVAWGPITEKVTLKKDEEQIIGSIVYSTSDNVSVYNSIDSKEALKSATDFDRVYILKIIVK